MAPYPILGSSRFHDIARARPVLGGSAREQHARGVRGESGWERQLGRASRSALEWPGTTDSASPRVNAFGTPVPEQRPPRPNARSVRPGELRRRLAHAGSVTSLSHPAKYVNRCCAFFHLKIAIDNLDITVVICQRWRRRSVRTEREHVEPLNGNPRTDRNPLTPNSLLYVRARVGEQC